MKVKNEHSSAEADHGSCSGTRKQSKGSGASDGVVPRRGTRKVKIENTTIRPTTERTSKAKQGKAKKTTVKKEAAEGSQAQGSQTKVKKEKTTPARRTKTKAKKEKTAPARQTITKAKNSSYIGSQYCRGSQREFKVAGISYHREECRAAERLYGSVGSLDDETRHNVKLIREPTNAYDPNAIKVIVSGHHIGYVPWDLTSTTDVENGFYALKTFMNNGRCSATIARLQ